MPEILQLHSSAYRNPAQLHSGDVLVVGAGNSGADIALELAARHHVVLSGRHPGQVPWRIGRRSLQLLNVGVFFAFSHVLTIRTPIGRKVRPISLAHSGPLIRIKSSDLSSAGVERAPRTIGTSNGLPLLTDGRKPKITNVVWCTGFRPDDSWIELPAFGPDNALMQDRGIVEACPRLYVLGRLFQYSLASSMVHGVGRDADYIARHIDQMRGGNALGTGTGARQGETARRTTPSG